ncbi:MAG: LamG domain-containing protein [Spartobacteria bacterium]|nr:LamG domain-containing protein [Spartobacteria bacterium]
MTQHVQERQPNGKSSMKSQTWFDKLGWGQCAWIGMTVAGLFFGVAHAVADGTNTVSLKFPADMVLPLNHVDTYFSSNNVSLYQQGGGSAGVRLSGGVIKYPVATNTSSPAVAYKLASSDFGHNIEHDKPDAYLGEPLDPPELEDGYSIDWSYMLSNGIPDGASAVYSPSVPAVYATQGGVLYLNWLVVNSADESVTTNQVTYTVANSSTGRPYRIYWTDDPYNAPPVSLAGQFYKIYYTVDCPAAVYQVTTNVNGIITSNVLYGVYTDSASNLRVAASDDNHVEGLFLLQYFKTGNYKEQTGMIVVEAKRPNITTVDADIGSPIWPVSAGYDTDGLEAIVTQSSGSDGTSYLFQQSGGTKDGWVFPVGSTLAEPWNIEIYWEAPDLMGTYWPFEVDWYAADWPDDPQLFVRGDGIGGDYGANVYVPSSMVASVMSYQEPPDHASIVSNNIFVTTTNNGLSLLRLDTDSDVWFVPVKSVGRTYSRFDLTGKVWDIGKEIRPFESAWSMNFPQYTSCLKVDELELADSFSLECWIYTPNLAVVTNGELVIFDQNTQAYSDYHDYNTIVRLQIEPANGSTEALCLNGYMSSGNSSADYVVDTYSATPLESYTWYHVMFTYDSTLGEASLYVNGELQQTDKVKGSRLSGSSAFYIGRRNNDGSESLQTNFRGLIDEVRIWTRALSESQAYSIYDGEMKGYSLDQLRSAGLQAYWPMSPDNIQNATDTSFELKDVAGGITATAYFDAVLLPEGAVGLCGLDGYSAYHGYIYTPFGTDYNADLYAESSSASPNANSYIYGVNTNSSLEVWWSQEMKQDDMPDPMYFPAQVQHYDNQWPESASEMVLASFAGSSAGNVAETGAALVLNPDRDSYAQAQSGVYFDGDFTIEGWVFLNKLTPYARLLEYGNGPGTNSIMLSVTAGSECRPYLDIFDSYGNASSFNATSLIPTGRWVHVAATWSDGIGTLYIDGNEAGSAANMISPEKVVRHQNYIGHSEWDDSAHPPMDGMVDEVRIWDSARTLQQIRYDMFANYELQTVDGLVMNLPFDEGEGVLTRDVVSGKWVLCKRAEWVEPGAPKATRHVYSSDENASIYYRNTSTDDGYNPNEEHAFITEYAGGYTVFALRDDLNRAGESEPYVLVNYQDTDTDTWKMDLFHVVRTNRLYQKFELEMTAGEVQPGPIPLTLLPNPWTSATTCDQGPGWRDRELVWWAKASTDTNDWQYATNEIAGKMIMRNYYPMQSSFWFPNIAAADQPAVQTPIPWLYDTTTNFWVIPNYPTKYDPIAVCWTVSWPTNVAQLDVGQTLTTAEGDLPDIWDQNSVDLLYQQSKVRTSVDSVSLYDPIQDQSGTLSYSLEEYGLETTGDHPAIYNRNGKYYFSDLSPDISGRLYFDPARSEGNLRFEGQDVAGLTQSYLLVNVLSDEQRQQVLDLVLGNVDSSNEYTDVQQDWNLTVSQLATSIVPEESNIPFDHLALTALGTGTGYITLVMNNATNQAMGVASSDPISMSVIQVTSNLTPGVVIPLEDGYNTLSDQMTMLHSLDFAGTQQHFEYDWRRHDPNADGTTPDDPDGSLVYEQGTGVYAVVIGGESATLDDMVNRFFAVRYRAVSSNAVAVCGTNWSEFTSFALSEGWVQRVLNAITPFEQRMRDLYDNEVETDGSMIQQAGAPYAGDVALNMDSVENVGLIQLYQTVLNRAIDLSLNQGIDSINANQQLMLAATRLNDLYMLLGNEAYSDAQDPTVGFGSTQSPVTGGSIDYGQMASSLFCFDNQVPTLLDEELALLRGVGTSNLSPGTDVYPVENRLWWNFTKGITAGEVAYAMNYNIKGLTNAIIDATVAKEYYPQGHGDAWGYYLDALWGYYSLMQYTNFDWGAPSITPMLMNDVTIDADYFDEEKFAQSAAAMARTGRDIVHRTYCKAYTEYSDGTLFPGYTDSNPDRAWGVSEWGSRAGMGAFYNWVAAQSLLPMPSDWQDTDASVTFSPDSYVALPDSVGFEGDFTIEAWVKLREFAPYAEALSFGTGSLTNNVFLSLSDNAALRPYLDIVDESGHSTSVSSDMLLDADTWYHIAVVLEDTTASLYINGELHGTQTGMNVPIGVIRTSNRLGLSDLGDSSHHTVPGKLSDVRIWDTARVQSDIQNDMNRRLAGTETGLFAYWPMNTGSGTMVYDLTRKGLNGSFAGDVSWSEDSPDLSISADFTDEGILKIDRSTVPALDELASTSRSIQREVDNADQCLNPLGLSRDAVLFDISPAALESGQSHFEQIEERAEKALVNAKSAFDAASEAGKVLRQQSESIYNFQTANASQERSYKKQLIEIYGYPYEDDIGTGRTYSEGYDGPDLYHYMYVDMAALGWSGTDIEPVDAFTYEFKADNDASYYMSYGFDTNAVAGTQKDGVTNTLTFSWAENGLPVMPSEWSGQRRAVGKLQTAWSDYLLAHLAYEKAVEYYEQRIALCDAGLTYYTETWYPQNEHIQNENIDLAVYEAGMKTVIKSASFIKDYKKMTALSKSMVISNAIADLPSSEIVGMSDGGDIFFAVRAALTAQNAAAAYIGSWGDLFSKHWTEALEITDAIWGLANKIDQAEWTFDSGNHSQQASLKEKTRDLQEALWDVKRAFETLNAAYNHYAVVLTEGERLLQEREVTREAAANQVASGRYRDMAFRLWRSDLLQRYASSFDLAAMYTYLAAKAYDYETAMLSTDAANDPGSKFLASVVKARTLGSISDAGEPLVGGKQGDPGLADILARMKANWSVLEGRLGFNNPEKETSQISLRSELFRILPGADGDENWRNALEACKVDDLFELDVFRRYCQPFTSQDGLNQKEPGLVIPFSSTIDYARNFFGKELAGGDHAFDSSHFATKIRSVGIWLSNYNANVSTTGLGLADTPRVYIVPAGSDAQRSPTDSSGTARYWKVLDQAVPVPYALDDDDLDTTDYIPLYDSLSGGFAELRRYASMRAYHDSGTYDESQFNSSSRLVGRSVWNTQWYLIIPAGTLNANRTLALESFINGTSLDGNGVKDIKIMFETYSNAGN